MCIISRFCALPSVYTYYSEISILLYIYIYISNMRKQDSTSSRKDNKRNEQENKYYIVEFEDGLQVIPHNWFIDQKQAFWPPFDNWKVYYNAVKNMLEPLDDWKIFTVLKIIGSASTFERAMDKLSMAEKTSDVSTDTDCNMAKIKRRRHARKQFSSEEESSESDVELSNKQLSPLPVPPQTKCSKTSTSNIGSFSQTRVTQQNTETFFNANKRSDKSDMVSDKNCNSCKVVQSFQQDILNHVVESNLRVKKCEAILQNLVEKMNQNMTTSILDIVSSDTDFYPEYLPAQTLVDFHAAEEKWKIDKEYKENVLQLFVKCKGTDIKSTIYSIMKNLMSNSVAMLYSWTGAKQQKEKFSKSPFRTVLQTTIMQLHTDATLQGIKKCITDWLRHAKERHTRQSRDNELAP